MAKILVVDDVKIIVKGIRFSLLQDQMEVDCAYDGEQAVEMARNTEYDVVLLDVEKQFLFNFLLTLHRQNIFLLSRNTTDLPDFKHLHSTGIIQLHIDRLFRISQALGDSIP